MSDWTGARIKTGLADELKARADAAGESFQAYLNSFIEHALSRPTLDDPVAIYVPVGRTEPAKAEFGELCGDGGRGLVVVYRDHANRPVVIAGNVQRLHASWLALQAPGCAELAIALDSIIAWQPYNSRNLGELYGIIPAWVRSGAIVHPWTPNAGSLVGAAQFG